MVVGAADRAGGQGVGINHETLRTWVRKTQAAERPGAAAEMAKDVELVRLRKEVAELEREILRKAAAYFARETNW